MMFWIALAVTLFTAFELGALAERCRRRARRRH